MQSASGELALVVGPQTPRVSPRNAPLWQGRRVIALAAVVTHVLALGLMPEVVVGRVSALPDEVRQQLQAAKVRVLTPAVEGPTAGLDFALNYAITTGARDVVCLGLVSPSMAETLANLLVLTHSGWGAARLTVIHGDEVGYLLRHGEAALLEGSAADRVTLIPLSPTVAEVTTQGLSPPQRYATLEFGHAVALTVEERPARVWIGAGRLLVVHTPAAAGLE